VHLLTDGNGLPLNVVVSPGQAHESQYVAPVLNAVRISGPGGGRPRQRPHCVAGDKGYSTRPVRGWLRAHGMQPVIPERSDQRAQREHRPGRRPQFDREVYRRRNVIERAAGLLKEARRIATRFEKLALHYLAVLKLEIIRLYAVTLLSFSNTP